MRNNVTGDIIDMAIAEANDVEGSSGQAAAFKVTLPL